MEDNKLANTSVHIPYDQKPQPYHRVVADLVSRHCKKDGVMLDIGVGVGHCLSLVQSKRPDIRLMGADIDQNCLDITGSRVKFDQTLLISDVDDLFDGIPKYDCVTMSHSLEHMLEPARVVREVMKIIRPGGVLVLAVPNPVRPQIFTTNLLRRKNVNLGHVYAWDRSHWMNFIEVILGLKVIEYAEDYFQLPFKLSERLRFLRPIELLLVRLFPWFAMSNIVAIRQTS